MQRYTRTDAWSIESNGVKYSIQPWEFETISVDVLDLYISASNLIDAEDDSFFNNTCAISIRGKAEFPRVWTQLIQHLMAKMWIMARKF